MKSISLFENWEFDDKGPHADPLHVNKNGRVILFTLKPGQTIREHSAPSSPFLVSCMVHRALKSSHRLLAKRMKCYGKTALRSELAAK